MKQCFRCKDWFPRESFYLTRSTYDGLYAHCRKCTRERNNESRKRNIEKARARGAANTKKMMEKYPEKYLARSKTMYAVKTGKLKRLPCEVCGEIKVDAHHPDYSKPLEVKWLCRAHHAEEHLIMKGPLPNRPLVPPKVRRVYNRELGIERKWEKDNREKTLKMKRDWYWRNRGNRRITPKARIMLAPEALENLYKQIKQK